MEMPNSASLNHVFTHTQHTKNLRTRMVEIVCRPDLSWLTLPEVRDTCPGRGHLPNKTEEVFLFVVLANRSKKLWEKRHVLGGHTHDLIA